MKKIVIPILILAVIIAAVLYNKTESPTKLSPEYQKVEKDVEQLNNENPYVGISGEYTGPNSPNNAPQGDENFFLAPIE